MSKTLAAELVPNLDALLDEIASQQEEVVITREGREVAKVTPLPDGREERRRVFERLRGSITIVGDIVEPLDEEWEANK